MLISPTALSRQRTVQIWYTTLQPTVNIARVVQSRWAIGHKTIDLVWIEVRLTGLVSLFQERGLMNNAFAFANKKAICIESSYIYTGTKVTYSSSSCTVGLALGSVTGFKGVTVNSVEAHMDALVQEPVSVAIGADSVFFQLYSGGVMTFWCGTNLDRGVLSAGCGTDGSSDY